MRLARNKGGVAAVPGLALLRVPAVPQLLRARLLVFQPLVNPFGWCVLNRRVTEHVAVTNLGSGVRGMVWGRDMETGNGGW